MAAQSGEISPPVPHYVVCSELGNRLATRYHLESCHHFWSPDVYQ
ncbi:MAG: hypothetical protein OEN02_04550 [Gammaproteobacteria bacterium]|nr:hypothetical protein [Gammaproteobacteria bacterium]MDH3536853.1 hypothetical protein [Gammaproteobacteria bacterium]